MCCDPWSARWTDITTCIATCNDKRLTSLSVDPLCRPTSRRTMSFDATKLADIAAGPFCQRDARRSVEHKMALELAVFYNQLQPCKNLRVVRVLYNAHTRVSAELQVSSGLAKAHNQVVKSTRRDANSMTQSCLKDDKAKHVAVTFHRSNLCTHLVLWIFKGPAWE